MMSIQKWEIEFLETKIVDFLLDLFYLNKSPAFIILNYQNFYADFVQCNILFFQRNDEIIIKFNDFNYVLQNMNIISNHKKNISRNKKVKILKYKLDDYISIKNKKN